MKKRMSRWAAAGLALLLGMLMLPWGQLAAQAAENVDVTIQVTYGQTEARAMLEYINLFRDGRDVDGQRPDYWNADDKTKTDLTGQLQPLIYDYSLEKTAMQRAAEIAICWSHTRPNGEDCFTAWEGSWRGKGENIAAGSTNAKGAFVQWREDEYNYAGQGHRRNMLDTRFNRIGIGHVVLNGVHFWSQAFGISDQSSTDPGAVDEVVPVRIEVSSNLIQNPSVAAVPEPIEITAGEKADLPSVSVKMSLSETWPSGQIFQAEIIPAWTVSPETVAKVEDGSLSGISAGSANLTADVFGNPVTVPVTVNGAPAQKGDVNGDGEIDAMDLTILAKHVAEIVRIGDESLLQAADVNADGEIDVKDLTHLAKIVAHII